MILGVLMEAAARSLAVAASVGLGLWMARARNARLETTVWTLVLAGAFVMPWLMRWRAIEIHPPGRVAATAPVVTRTVRESVAPVAIPRTPAEKQVNWWAIGVRVYAGVAAVLLLRVLTGLWLTFLIWRRARRVRQPWAAELDTRETVAIGAPATFGSSILLPANWRDWDELKLRAVIAHERAHVQWGDFYVQLLGRMHVAVFWFSPLAWWLENRLIHLAEAASDDAALEAVAERSLYAEILLGLAGKLEQAPAAVTMARPATVSRRVERVLSSTEAPLKIGWKRYAQVGAAVVCGVAIIAGCTTRAQTGAALLPAQSPEAPAKPAARPAPPPAPPEHPREDKGHRWWWQMDKAGDTYAIVSGDSLTMSGSSGDAERARSFRSQIPGEYIWFEHEGKQYLIADQATIQRVKKLFRSEEQLGREQAELAKKQARLGEQQALLGEKQAAAGVKMPALDERLREANALVKDLERGIGGAKLTELAGNEELFGKLEKQLQTAKGAALTQEQLGQLQGWAAEAQAKAAEGQARLSEDLASRLAELQGRMAELQSELGELQSRVGEKQSKLGEEQSLLGDEQAKLGEAQSKLGEEQATLAEKASRELRRIFEECLNNGLAKAAE
jgi:beta-lactamase regulating signal transducer with metallopeptidase domain